LTKEILEKYQPQKFLLIGCATGNGLEHIDVNVTVKSYALDINPEYVRITRDRYENKIKGLTVLCVDIETSNIMEFEAVDLIFCPLVLEYVNPSYVLVKLAKMLNNNGRIVIVTQETIQSSFVSKSNYKSLESLKSIAKEWSVDSLVEICSSLSLVKESSQRKKISPSKVFNIVTLTRSFTGSLKK
jgi:SAM-dependent methyltransferase